MTETTRDFRTPITAPHPPQPILYVFRGWMNKTTRDFRTPIPAPHPPQPILYVGTGGVVETTRDCRTPITCQKCGYEVNADYRSRPP